MTPHRLVRSKQREIEETAGCASPFVTLGDKSRLSAWSFPDHLIEERNVPAREPTAASRHRSIFVVDKWLKEWLSPFDAQHAHLLPARQLPRPLVVLLKPGIIHVLRSMTDTSHLQLSVLSVQSLPTSSRVHLTPLSFDLKGSNHKLDWKFVR
jgi:hypothetical protein